MSRSAAFLLPVAAILSGCAPPPVAAPASSAAMSGGRECFFAGNVNSFTPRSDEVVDIQVGARRYYRLGLAGTCPGVKWRNAAVLRTLGGSSWICAGRGLDAELIIRDPGLGPLRCPVTSVRRLSDAEARALRYYR